MTSPTQRAKTLVFCTSYTPPEVDSYYAWDIRYRIWLEAIKHSNIEFDQILIVDDGSKFGPSWDDITVLTEEDDLECLTPVVMYHFRDRLGRKGVSDFPGWVRSFFFASYYAEANNFTRIVHIEADAFIITRKAADFINGIQDGWTAFWCDRFKRPESGIQVIAGSGLAVYKHWASKPISYFSGLVIESTLPFTHIDKILNGDRYGEFEVNRVPKSADWCMQARPPASISYQNYFWWMPWLQTIIPNLGVDSMDHSDKVDFSQTGLVHDGIYYLELLGEACSLLTPRNYLEIGTHAGEAIKKIPCDVVCVDPKFEITSNVIMRRKNSHFYQGTSDEFFADQPLVKRLFPDGVDLAFLDGLHLYEALLSDFINTERLASSRSVILLHDCLPLNERMAERERRDGGNDEPVVMRDFWTGDVWKVVLILKKYRPDISISYLNCPPTGVIVCSNLDSSQSILRDRYNSIVDEFAGLSLSSYGLKNLWGLSPMFNATQVVSNEEVFNRVFFPHQAPLVPFDPTPAPVTPAQSLLGKVVDRLRS